MKNILKWVGSKYNQPAIYQIVQQVFERSGLKTFAEPFAGGLGMTYRIESERYLAFDINHHLIDFYQAVKDGYQWEPNYQQLSYKELRNLLENPTAFYLVNKCSFNGLFRTNSNGVFNTPGNGKSPGDIELPDLEPYRKFYQRISFQRLSVWDYEPYKTDFIYCDPPYFGTFSDYSKEPFRGSDHLRLIKLLKSFPNPSILSNSAHPNLISIYDNLGIHYQFVETKQTFNNSTMLETLAFFNC